MQTHAGTTGRTFSYPTGGVRERVNKEKLVLYGDLCFYFHDLSHKLSLTLTMIPLGKQPFQHKGTAEEAKQKKILPSRQLMLFHCHSVPYHLKF